jgi:hypothetical protein
LFSKALSYNLFVAEVGFLGADDLIVLMALAGDEDDVVFLSSLNR